MSANSYCAQCGAPTWEGARMCQACAAQAGNDAAFFKIPSGLDRLDAPGIPLSEALRHVRERSVTRVRIAFWLGWGSVVVLLVGLASLNPALLLLALAVGALAGSLGTLIRRQAGRGGDADIVQVARAAQFPGVTVALVSALLLLFVAS
jgi:hypothetical protein